MAQFPGTYAIPTRPASDSVRGRAPSFLNFTDLDKETAQKIHEEKRELVMLGEQYAIDRLERAQKAEDLRNGKIWNKQDEDFFSDLDLSAYEINIQRPLFNTIANTQQEQEYRFRVAPKDIHAHQRYQKGKADFVEHYAAQFGSEQEASRYFDEVIDDEFGIMLSALMMDSRDVSNGDDAESECFDDGAITGMAAMKVTYSTKYDRQIGLNHEAVPQNALIYDEARSKDYACDDISFIGEIHDYYPEDLIEEYPEYSQEIENTYRHLIENRRTFQTGNDATRWKDWYEFTDGHGAKALRLKVAELWTRHTEEKIRVIDKETNKIKVSKFGVTIDQVIDRLMEQWAKKLFQETINSDNFSQSDLERFSDPTLKEQLAQRINERYEFEKIFEPIWYKTIFSFNGIFEHSRSPYPHESHPYTLYFSQYHHGSFRGLGEDVSDVIIAFNKAVAFRELMMAHGAKNVLLVDEETLAENDLNKEDLADQWTRIGPVIALKLRPGMRMGDVALPVNTVGQNMDIINNIIAHYSSLMNQILGVTAEQLGSSSADAPASRFNMQIQQGMGNNAVIFKNFNRTLKMHYRKALTMEVEVLKVRKERVIRLLGDEYRFFFDSNFLNVEWNEEFQMFEETLKTGQYGLSIIPVKDDPQTGAAREGIMFELAGQGAIPIELAFKYSSWDKRHQFVRDLKKQRNKQYLEALQNQVDANQLAEIMATKGVDAEVADEILEELRLQNVKKLRSSQNETGFGMPQQKGNNGRISALAAKMGQSQRIEQNLQTGFQPDQRQANPQNNQPQPQNNRSPQPMK